jgi:2'-5' RNA ligase
VAKSEPALDSCQLGRTQTFELRIDLKGNVMTEQLALFGGDEPSSGSRRPAAAAVATNRKVSRHALFLALVPGEQDAQAISMAGRLIARECSIRGNALEPSRLHVSLYTVGEYGDIFPQDLVDTVMAAATRVVNPAFDVVFDRVATFGGAGESRPFVLKSATDDALATLHAFRRALGMALADAGLPITNRKMTPHMTLCYAAQVAPELAIAPVQWQAHEFALIDSHVGAHVHRVLGRWALAG